MLLRPITAWWRRNVRAPLDEVYRALDARIDALEGPEAPAEPTDGDTDAGTSRQPAETVAAPHQLAA